MAEGADRARWNHTAAIVAAVVNMHRDPKKKPLPDWKFHPYERAERGKGKDLRALAEKMMSLKGVNYGALNMGTGAKKLH